MAIISPNYDLLYLCTAKTGSTSLSNVMLESFQGEWVPKDHVWKDGKIVVDYKHSTLQELLNGNFVSQESIEKINIFLTIRNPFSWVLSDYLFQCKCYKIYQEKQRRSPDWILSRIDIIIHHASMTFEEYVIFRYIDREASVYNHYIEGFKGRSNITLIKMENMQNDFSEYLSNLSISNNVKIPHANKTLEKQVSYRDYYTPLCRSIIESAFKQDLLENKYSF